MDTSRNLARTVTNQLAVLYDQPPKISNEDADLDQFRSEIKEAGLWSIDARNCRNTIGLRESLIRADYSTELGQLTYRAVTPDMVYAEASPDQPDEPDYIIEARVRSVDLGKGKGPQDQWTWDCLDVRPDREPKYKVLLPDGRTTVKEAKDITAQVLGGDFSGAAYPYRIEGEPVLPYALYHAQRTGRLWDSFEGQELFESTLLVACYWSFFGYCLRDSTFSQRWGIGVNIGGGQLKGTGKSTRREVHLDPTSFAIFNEETPGSGRLGQFGAAVDPERLQLAIDQYEQRTLAHAGLSPDDLQRSGGAESGYALALRRETVRRLQRGFEPQFSRGDLRLLALSAALLNANTGSSLPESGYSIRYVAVPPSPSERASRLEEVKAKFELGLASPVDFILAEQPGLDRAEAAAALETVREERVEFKNMDRTDEGLPGEEGETETKVEFEDKTEDDSEVKAADTALNGAQVKAATEIVAQVAVGVLPRDAGVAMLVEFFNINKQSAERVMGTVGRGFKPAAPQEGTNP